MTVNAMLTMIFTYGIASDPTDMMNLEYSQILKGIIPKPSIAEHVVIKILQHRERKGLVELY